MSIKVEGTKLENVQSAFLLKDDKKTNTKTFEKKSETEISISFEEVPMGEYRLYILDGNNSYVNFKQADDSKFKLE